MFITRTRIARLAAVSAVVVSLGALTAGPAAAQSGDIGSRPASVDSVTVEDPSSVTLASDDATSTTAVAGWHYIGRYFWKVDCNRDGQAGVYAGAWSSYSCRYGSLWNYYELWVFRA